jgi:uncharacterized membrane protein YsdA (DUF1294 family)
MNMFRHKTKKEPFRTYYFGCVAANVAIMGGLAAAARRDPNILRRLFR